LTPGRAPTDVSRTHRHKLLKDEQVPGSVMRHRIIVLRTSGNVKQ